jgi:predicted transposase YdaD
LTEKELPHDLHDRGYKRLLSFWKIFQQLIEGYVDAEWKERLDFPNSEKIDKSFILKGFEKREADVLYKVPLLGEDMEVYLYVLIELQSTVDFSLAFRVLTYLVEIWLDFYKNADEKMRKQKHFRLPPVLPIVLYNGSGSWTAATSLIKLVEHGELFAKYLPNVSYHLVDIPRVNQDTLKRIGNCLSGIFLLEQEINSQEFEDSLLQALEFIDQETDDELWKAIIDWLLMLLKREMPDKVVDAIKKVDLSKHSRQEVRSMLETMPKKLVAYGREEGRKEGHRESILKVLEAKFKNVTAVEIRNSLATITTSESLEALLKTAAVAHSLVEFKDALSKMTDGLTDKAD